MTFFILRRFVVAVLMSVGVTFLAAAQVVREARFENISTTEGLSNNNINHIYQDYQGYIWISTLSGLNRYDGYEIKSFFHKANDPTTLLNNTVVWVAEGPDQMLWVKNGGGISLYNPYSEQFQPADKYLEILKTDAVFITKIIKDAQGNFWVSIDNRGVMKIAGDQLTSFGTTADHQVRLASNSITDMWLDKAGNLGVVHAFGQIEVINTTDNKVIRRYGFPEKFTQYNRYWKLFMDSGNDIWLYSTEDNYGLFYINTKSGESRILDEEELTSPIVRGIVEQDNGELWIGVDHGGVCVLNKENWKIRTIQNNPDISKSLVNNNVNALFKDQNGGTWVGTSKSGLSYHYQGAENFSHFKVDKRDPEFNDMSSFVEDAAGNIWIGTNGKGLLKFNRKTKTFEIPQASAAGAPIPEVIVSLCYTKDQRLLIGSYLGGLYEYDGKTCRKLDVFGNATSVSVWEVFEDSRGNIWLGTLSQGTYVIDKNTGVVAHYDQSNFLNSNYVTCMMEDSKGQIWLGTGVGLHVYNPQTDRFQVFLVEDGSDHPLSNNSIVSLEEDQKGNIWVGTLDGLNRYLGNDDFQLYTVENGLASNIVMAISEDQNGALWMSTSRGISKMTFDGEEFGFQNFGISDGLQGESFTEDAYLKTADGALIFGGQNGFNIFRPEDIQINDASTRLMFTRFLVGNEPLIPGAPIDGRVILTKSLEQTQKISLDYDENSFSIEFHAVSFSLSDKIRYQYKLDGYDVNWINASPENRKVNYANLDYGNYTFHVRVSNNANTWQKNELIMEISVRPPFWQTPWAYLLYIAVLVILLSISRTLIIRKEREKAYAESEKREAERQHQLDMMKIRFFTNISHEFRTPLSLILTPIERMLKSTEQIKVDELKIVQRNANRLMTLVNQLLDFRKLEANQHRLSQSSGDIITFLQDIIYSFSDLSREKRIALEFKSDIKSFYTFFDKDKMEKIMFNLISNAMKFTRSGGNITVDFEVIEKAPANPLIMIMVTDTGIGIPKDKHELIFNRFFQHEISGDIVNNGTGIGLSITKEFVELHGGKISVDSKPDMGSTFIVELPLKEISSDEDLVDGLVEELAQSVHQRDENTDVIDSSKPTVLLVEDNYDFRFYLKDNLKQYYNVTVASNGKEAWKMIKNDPPDVIISDVMMPIMDGHELCEKVKSDPRTLHIPVILLTAQSSDQHRIAGLEAGAIEYISKPFNFEILISSINSALKFQRRVQESEHKIKVQTSEVDIVSMDEQLITKAVAFVEANISNSEFSVEDLSHELGYSRGHFYQKILKITGQSPIDFIRNIRMKRAADLLERSQLNVSEVAYKVGYNNPKLFSRYFKSVYNMYPSEYRGKTEEPAE